MRALFVVDRVSLRNARAPTLPAPSGNVDEFVPNTITDLATRVLAIVTQLALVVAFAPWLALAVPALMVPYAKVLACVRPAARDTRRLEGIARAPVYTHFGDTLAARAVIKAFGAGPRFERENGRLVSRMAAAKYANEAGCKWAQALSTVLGCAFYLAAGVACAVLQAMGRMTAAQLGLVLLYAASLQRVVMEFMMGLTAVETQFVSVERVAECVGAPLLLSPQIPRMYYADRDSTACTFQSGDLVALVEPLTSGLVLAIAGTRACRKRRTLAPRQRRRRRRRRATLHMCPRRSLRSGGRLREGSRYAGWSCGTACIGRWCYVGST